VLVVGGGGRGAGKTAVACALMAAMPELRWVAVKVSPHSHGLQDGVWEEQDRESEKDTGRYLRAGARRAFLVRGGDDAGEVVEKVRVLAADCDSGLVESNRVMASAVAKPGEPVVSIAVLAGGEEEWKASLFETAGRIDALVLAGGPPRTSFDVLEASPVFALEAGKWVNTELIDLIRNRLLPRIAES